MAQRLLRRISRWLKSESTRYFGKASLIVVAVTVVSYWISYQDRIANRQNAAWDGLRAAIGWVESPGHWGNAGQVGAIETLTHDCGYWWHNTFLAPAFALIYHDCVDLNSMSLANMELGSLQAVGGNFSYSDLSCSNLAQANLRNANLQATKFRGANLAGIDLRGAILTNRAGDPTIDPVNDADLWLADLSTAMMDASTKVKLAQLKCACIAFTPDKEGKLAARTNEHYVTAHELLAALRGLQPCPPLKCGDAAPSSWQCSK